MSKKNTDNAKSIEVLTSEYEQLNQQKIRAQTQLEEANRQLDKLQKEAVSEFGTADLQELKAKLEQMERENEKQRSEYQELLEGIASDLKKIEDAAGESGPEHAD